MVIDLGDLEESKSEEDVVMVEAKVQPTAAAAESDEADGDEQGAEVDGDVQGAEEDDADAQGNEGDGFEQADEEEVNEEGGDRAARRVRDRTSVRRRRRAVRRVEGSRGEHATTSRASWWSDGAFSAQLQQWPAQTADPSGQQLGSIVL
jgi:hypothetical protein